MRSTAARDLGCLTAADLQRRLNSLEQNSSRGSTISTASSTGSRPLNDRFGLNHDQNGGSSSSNNVPAGGNSPSRPNETAPSAIVPNPSGRGRESRHGDRSPERTGQLNSNALTRHGDRSLSNRNAAQNNALNRG